MSKAKNKNNKKDNDTARTIIIIVALTLIPLIVTIKFLFGFFSCANEFFSGDCDPAGTNSYHYDDYDYDDDEDDYDDNSSAESGIEK